MGETEASSPQVFSMESDISKESILLFILTSPKVLLKQTILKV